MSEDLLQQQKAMMDAACKAAEEFSTMDAEKVQHICAEVTQACVDKVEFYAKWAVKETTYGNVGDKIVKNIASSLATFANNDAYDFCVPKVNSMKKIIEIPKPAGVVVALIPVTNPVATVMFKALSALFTRNAIILCPHPAAKGSSNHAAKLMAEIAEKAGAPKNCIQWLDNPSVDSTGSLMRDDRTSVILATGGPGMVRAAYSSGNPALGVGPANVACYVDRSANIKRAAKRIANSACYDNMLPCTVESVVLADRAIADKLRKALTAHEKKPAVWVTGENVDKLRDYVWPEGKFNAEALGKDADWIANKAGFSVPAGTRTLLVEIDKIAYEEPFSKEKMCPILGFMVVEDKYDGLEKTKQMIDLGGRGHSCVIHTKDPEVKAMFGLEIPVCRISCNAEGSLGSSGFVTNLPAGAVIGTGFFGRSSLDRNFTPSDLIQHTRVAQHILPNETLGNVEKYLKMPSVADRVKHNAKRGADIARMSVQVAPLAAKYA